MPIFQKRFRVSNGTDTSDFIHSEIFESLPERLGLKFISGDEFSATTQQNLKTGGDGVKSYGWNILNSANADAVDVNITNAGYLTIDCGATSIGWDNALFTGIFVYKNITGNFDVETFLAGNETLNYHRSGIMARDTGATAGEDWVCIHQTYNTGNKIAGWNTVNNVSSGTSDDVASIAKYLRMTRVGNVFTTYYKVNVGDTWTLKRQDTRNDFGATIQVGLISGTYNTNNTYIAKFDYARGWPGYYPPNGPFPGQVWETLALNSLVKWSTARILIYKNGTVQAASNADVKFQHAVNGGAFNGSWLTLSGLRGIPDTTISDATNSVMLKAQYNSNGTDLVESDVYMVMDVDAPAAGGGGSRLLDGGLMT